MVTDAARNTFVAIYLCSGYTDLRKNIDGLAALLMTKYGRNAYKENELYLFCGRCAYKIKGLVWERNGFVLFSKRLREGRYQWIRDESKGLVELSYEQFIRLMNEGSIE